MYINYVKVTSFSHFLKPELVMLSITSKKKKNQKEKKEKNPTSAFDKVQIMQKIRFTINNLFLASTFHLLDRHMQRSQVQCDKIGSSSCLGEEPC